MKKTLVVCFGLLASLSQALLVDDFSQGAYNSGYFSSGSVTAWNTAANVPGGVRFIKAQINSNPQGNDMRVRVQPAFNTLQVSSESQVDAQLSLIYGLASGSQTPGSNPLNLNLVSNPVISIGFQANDVTLPTTVRLHLNDSATILTRGLNVSGGINSLQFFDFDFSSDAALMNDVDIIEVFFDPATGGDFSLGSVQAVPEPITFAVLGLGLLGLRKRKS